MNFQSLYFFLGHAKQGFPSVHSFQTKREFTFANFNDFEWNENTLYVGCVLEVFDIFFSSSLILVLSYDISNWLLQHPGLDGQEVSLKLHHDGHMGSFEDSSGKYSLKNNVYI